MNIVVDTSVWSLILRRRHVEESNPFVSAFRNHIERGDAIHLTGMILQELLDGVLPKDFERLVRLLQPFPLISAARETHILASQLRNECRRKGVQANPIDFLITAICIEQGFPLLTADCDFVHIARHCKLPLLQ